MCTLTWRLHSNGYEIHFNRDESRLRPTAIPAKLHPESKPRVISPIDPQGGGSWIALNEFGLSVCLLNNYQGLSRNFDSSRSFQSRGLLVKFLGECTDIDHALSAFEDFDLATFAAFDLLLFFPSVSPKWMSWNGAALTLIESTQGFTSSSGFEPDLVIGGRRKQFVQHGEKDLFDLHTSHNPDKSAFSVCMHRDDARTQSYSRIIVNSDLCQFWYSDGPPCSSVLGEPISLVRSS